MALPFWTVPPRPNFLSRWCIHQLVLSWFFFYLCLLPSFFVCNPHSSLFCVNVLQIQVFFLLVCFIIPFPTTIFHFCLSIGVTHWSRRWFIVVFPCSLRHSLCTVFFLCYCCLLLLLLLLSSLLFFPFSVFSSFFPSDCLSYSFSFTSFL